MGPNILPVFVHQHLLLIRPQTFTCGGFGMKRMGLLLSSVGVLWSLWFAIEVCKLLFGNDTATQKTLVEDDLVPGFVWPN
jgi:hypothetical protein